VALKRDLDIILGSKQYGCSVRFSGLTAASVNMTVFWDVAPYSLIEMADDSEVLTASIIRATSALIMKVISTSETSISFYHTTRLNIPEDNHLNTYVRLTIHDETYAIYFNPNFK
jgi:hypothetical protein